MKSTSHQTIIKEINAIILHSYQGISSADQKEQLKTINNTHKISREGGDCHENLQMSITYFTKRMDERHAALETSIDNSFTNEFIPIQRDLDYYRIIMRRIRNAGLTNPHNK